MNRRPPPGRRREFPREEGPFDRLVRSRFERDPAPLIIGGTIIFLAILILILFLPPLSLLGGDGDGGPVGPLEVGCGITATLSDELPDLPEGLVHLSPLYELNVPSGAEEQGCRLTTISLDTPTQDSSNLAFYTYRDGTWVRLVAATLANDGAAAEAELGEIPDNLVVLRLAAATYLAVGSLPSGTSVDPAAEGLLSIVSPMDYAPDSDGSIVGTASSLATDEGFDVFPTIAALEGDAASAVNAILDDSSLTTSHIEGVVSLTETGDFQGIDIDYRQVNAQVGSEFSQFIADLAQELHKTGRKLSITLPMPSVQDGSIDTGAYDWEQLGKSADYVKILPESDQSLYRNRMFQVLRYATGIVEPGKIFLVVSPFSHEKSTEGVQALDFLQASLSHVGTDGGHLLADLLEEGVEEVRKRVGPDGLAEGMQRLGVEHPLSGRRRTGGGPGGGPTEGAVQLRLRAPCHDLLLGDAKRLGRLLTPLGIRKISCLFATPAQNMDARFSPG